jgi:hypothetical protein
MRYGVPSTRARQYSIPRGCKGVFGRCCGTRNECCVAPQSEIGSGEMFWETGDPALVLN